MDVSKVNLTPSYSEIVRQSSPALSLSAVKRFYLPGHDPRISTLINISKAQHITVAQCLWQRDQIIRRKQDANSNS